MNRRLFMRIINTRWLQHVLFWGLAYYILLRVFASSSQVLKIDFIYTAVFLLTLAAGVYVNLLILVPLFLGRKKYILYAFLLLVCICASAGLNMLTFSRLIDYLIPGYYFISYYDFIDVVKFFIAFIGLTSLIKFSKSWFLLMEAKNQLISLQKEHAETELKALTGQINPHFLFNSLNSIYSLVLKKSEHAPEVILKLSAFMRYLLYETSSEQVDLAGELRYMQDYIDLQKLRAGNRARISVRIEGEPENKKIAPLLLLPLIENSFKHGIKGETGPSFVDIKIRIEPDKMYFQIENNKGQVDPVETDKYRGIGLENLRKRLERIYPGQSALKIDDSGDVYKVELLVSLLYETTLPGHRG